MLWYICFKKAHRPKYMYLSATLSEEKLMLYYYLLMGGESLQMSIYFLIFYELYILLFISLIEAIRLALFGPYYIWNVFFPHQEVNLTTETALTEQKYSFVFNTIYHNVQPWTNTLQVILVILGILQYCFFLFWSCCACCVCTYHNGHAIRKLICIVFVLILLLYIFG